jgi:hypothetical protein
MRTEVCFRFNWENVRWSSGRFGVPLVTRGKTSAARRVIPMTRGSEPSSSRDGKKQVNQKKAGYGQRRQRAGMLSLPRLRSNTRIPLKPSRKPRRVKARSLYGPSSLYSFRPFLTRLRETGCDAWTLERIAGHSSIAISARYVHPSEDAVLDAMSRQGGQQNWAQSRCACSVAVAEDVTIAVH